MCTNIHTFTHRSLLGVYVLLEKHMRDFKCDMYWYQYAGQFRCPCICTFIYVGINEYVCIFINLRFYTTCVSTYAYVHVISFYDGAGTYGL